MTKNELMHFGIKGMKWGVRRYQNKDGTLTPAGKKRYDRDIIENNARRKENRIQINGPDASRWTREDLSRAKRSVDSTAGLVNNVRSLNQYSMNKRRKKETLDLSNMTDKELRDRINRADLERRYNDLFADEQSTVVSRGQKRIDDILRVGGNVLAVGSSALAIALAIKELKG